MKKAFAFITIIIIVASLIFGLFAQSTYATDADKKFVAPIIPKADNLPGPDASMVGEEGARKILSERVLPKFAVSTIGLVGGLSLLFLIIGGVRFATAYGKEESVENAKKQVIYAIIGLLIALLSYTIVSIVTNIQLKNNTSLGNINDQPEADGMFPAGQEVSPELQKVFDDAAAEESK